jgi:tRNA A-37 threonylcarbamoyl transferase component Bud32
MLLERVRLALSAEYEIQREIAAGGMGVVYQGRQRRLDRPVAIKILRPELATAIAAERFLAEGRILARLSHPNIVPIYDAGEADGLLYYVMELVEGESLADRLLRGHLDPAECLVLSRDLLRGLGAAHGLGVVHRDVKPANVFLRKGQALLGDFGIARWQEGHEAALTTPGQQIGTPRYMSPEQRDGTPVTARTDVYAAGLLIWETCTGTRWPAYRAPEQADWSGIPAPLAPVLRRALQVEPAARWPNAGEMERALAGSASRTRWPRLAGAAVVAALLGWLIWPTQAHAPQARGSVSIGVARFAAAPGVDRALADSITGALRSALAYPDFYVLPAETSADSSALRVSGTLTLVDGRLRMRARAVGGSAEWVETEGDPARWPELAEDLARRVVHAVWTSDAAADLSLPLDALPTTERGFDEWFRGEQLLGQARWEEAGRVFLRIARSDSSCYLCSFRLLDIDRWLGRPHEPALISRLEASLGRFPPHYQRLVRAALTPLPARLDTLALAAKDGSFFLGAFEYGDELFHRGPLYGYPRQRAIEPLQQVVRQQPRFGPGWEHLTWLLLSEGDAASAGTALGSLSALPRGAEDGFAASMRLLLELGYHWRFLEADSARKFSRLVLSQPALASSNDAVAGGRLMMTADAPRGAVELGGLIARAWPGRADAIREGLLGQLYGYAALGRLDSLRATGLRLERATSDPGLPLLALELEATLRGFDPDSAVRDAPELLAALEGYSRPGAHPPALVARAALAAGFLALRSGRPARALAATDLLTQGPLAFQSILHAARLAERGESQAALDSLPGLPPLEAAERHPSPLADAMVRLLRSEQLERLGQSRLAGTTLLWHQHLQVVGRGTGDPAPGEMAWALGTLVRWRLGHSADNPVPERCSALAAVARHWSQAAEPFRSRADSSQRLLRSLACTG